MPVSARAQDSLPWGRIDGVGVARYFPLTLGASWVYAVTLDGTPSPNPMQVVVGQIIPAPAGKPGYLVTVIDLSVKPEERADAPLLYVYDNHNALECVDCGGIVLRGPFTAGQSWPLGTQGTYSITADNAVVELPDHHHFTGCLIVEISEPAADLVSEIAYAPGIGPVRMRYRHPGNAEGAPFREEDLTDFLIAIPPHLPQAVGRG